MYENPLKESVADWISKMSDLAKTMGIEISEDAFYQAQIEKMCIIQSFPSNHHQSILILLLKTQRHQQLQLLVQHPFSEQSSFLTGQCMSKLPC